MRTMHMFAGAGGGLLADLILGHEPVCAVEQDAYCCAVLRERAAAGWFPGLHVHEGDIRMFDPSTWTRRVDCIHAGFPCQDISLAGTGAGIDGERSGLWSEVVRVADEIRPQELFLENSPAITSRGLGRVLGDLAELGFDAEWCVLSASAVGAPHFRARWWCLARRTVAHPDSNHSETGNGQHGRRNQRRAPAAGHGGNHAANAMRQRQQGIIPESIDEKKRQEQGQRQAGSCSNGCSNGFGWWSIEPGVGRVADGVAARAHRIRALGNGQVPLQAAAAYVLLNARLGT